MILQPPSYATPADVDLRSTSSVDQSLSTIISNVSTFFQGSSFNVQSRVPVRYLQMRFALCMSRGEGRCIPLAHLLDTEMNIWAFSSGEHQFAHNRSVFSGTSSRDFSFGILDSDRTPGECTGWQFSKSAQDNKVSKSFARGLTRNHRSVLINRLPTNFVSDPSCGQLVFNRRILPMAVNVLSSALSGPTNTPSSMCLHIMTIVGSE